VTVTAALISLSCESPRKAEAHHLCTIYSISTIQIKHHPGNISTVSQETAVVGTNANVHPRCSIYNI